MKNRLFLSLLSFCFFGLLPGCVPVTDASMLSAEEAQIQQGLSYEKLKLKAAEAKDWCRKNKMDTSVCLLADMRIHSGLERMVVWDFNTDTVMASGLVSHGCSASPWGKDHSKDKPVFSNQPDSHASSLGKYSIGKRGYSQWGIHVKYLMHGLEASNKNALKREIVLHGWDAIADAPVYPDGTPEGWGCPAVSNTFMTRLDEVLKTRQKPVLLWVYR